jgi:glycosyltransferase involved in cell wall biosynthesis
VKLAVVVQRYGVAINGGAELHARYVAEHLARHATVEVLTTCASDYVTWHNEFSAGVETVNGVTVRRFPVKHDRKPQTFGRRSNAVFFHTHSLADELAWIDAEGPSSTALVAHISRHAAEYDYLIFFSYRYYQAYHGARAAGARAILVPTAERDAAIGLSIFKPLFRGVRALMYNSPEEQAMIHAVADNRDRPGVVVGVGSDVPTHTQADRFRQKFNIREPFAVYVGRVDENKGCTELFTFFQEYVRHGGRLSLVLIGQSLLPIPAHPRIRHLGFLDDADKFDAMAASELLIMPSYLESLSMVALEAWALGRPVLANGRCDVLKGQCIRSRAGLYYDDVEEFIETLDTLDRTRWLNGTLGRNGREFFKEQYDWPVIERKYLNMFERLSAEPPAKGIEPLPGWFERRSTQCPAGAAVMASLPAGPCLSTESGAVRPRPQEEPSVEGRPDPPPADSRWRGRGRGRPPGRQRGASRHR